MSTKTAQKKAAPAKDWHPADIKAELAKAGWSMRQLGLSHGVTGETLRRALAKPYPKSERIIADALGIKPETIWPTRYDADGNSNRQRGRQPVRPDTVRYLPGQSSTAGANSNMQTHKAA